MTGEKRGSTTRSAALHDMERKIDELPLLPHVLVKILQLSPSSDDYFDRLIELAKEDPAFAVRIVALANSAASFPTTPIRSIENALARMGSTAISSLVASLAVQRVFMPKEPYQKRLWSHSVTAAVATQAVAKLVPKLDVDAGRAYLCGLLHDIGCFVLFEHASEELSTVEESNWQSFDELIEKELEVFGFTHAELGYLACKHWGIPDDVASVVRHHHSALKGEPRPASSEAACFCVQIADRLCVYVLQDPALGEMTSAEREKRIRASCLGSDRDRALIHAAGLNSSADRILAESGQLLSGLGLS